MVIYEFKNEVTSFFHLKIYLLIFNIKHKFVSNHNVLSVDTQRLSKVTSYWLKLSITALDHRKYFRDIEKAKIIIIMVHAQLNEVICKLRHCLDTFARSTSKEEWVVRNFEIFFNVCLFSRVKHLSIGSLLIINYILSTYISAACKECQKI